MSGKLEGPPHLYCYNNIFRDIVELNQISKGICKSVEIRRHKIS
jgi:hypothetical protein